ncbi:50S ribosomal protein L28 [Candidatus Kaiserbacteria bacterium]|nr:50S ribosomal protein L28 [Candidatus Kaiserbacteria bacterium]
MARVCAITGKTSQVGGGYSNRVRATKFNPTGKRRRQVNLQKKTMFIPELGKKVTLTVSTKALKTMKKRGAFITLQKAGLV